jgi:hypothetical protein
MLTSDAHQGRLVQQVVSLCDSGLSDRQLSHVLLDALGATHVDLFNSPDVGGRTMAALANMRSLVALNLGLTACLESVPPLEACRRLIALNLSYCRETVDSKSWKALQALDRVVLLGLSGLEIDEALRLTSMKSLKHLLLRFCPLDPSRLGQLLAGCSLVSLDIGAYKFHLSDHLLSRIAFGTLRALNLSGCTLQSNQSARLWRDLQVEFLGLASVDGDGIHQLVECLPLMPSLRCIDVSYYKGASSDLVQVLSRCGLLEAVVVTGIPALSIADVRSLVDVLPQMRAIVAYDTDIGEPGAQELRNEYPWIDLSV